MFWRSPRTWRFVIRYCHRRRSETSRGNSMSSWAIPLTARVGPRIPVGTPTRAATDKVQRRPGRGVYRAIAQPCEIGRAGRFCAAQAADLQLRLAARAGRHCAEKWRGCATLDGDGRTCYSSKCWPSIRPTGSLERPIASAVLAQRTARLPAIPREWCDQFQVLLSGLSQAEFDRLRAMQLSERTGRRSV